MNCFINQWQELTSFLVILPNCCVSTAEVTDFFLILYTKGYFSTKRSPTLHGQGWHNLLIHVIHVVSHDEVGRVRPSTAHPAGVYVEGSHQGVDARVIDNLEATEDLNLLPPVQTLPQCCCHLAQCLPEDRWKRTTSVNRVENPTRTASLFRETNLGTGVYE